MRTYVVKSGDSPASIAAQDAHAGCPKCSVDLIRSNLQKETVRYPNGFVTFRDLRVGEVLNLPDKWFDGTLDRMPQSYFDALPYADGVTPSKGTLGQTPQPVVDAVGSAQAAVAAIAVDPNYCVSVSRSGSAVNTAVHDFKVAFNAWSTGAKVPVGTGTYEQATADAIATVLGASPPACGVRQVQLPTMNIVSEREPQRLSTGAVVGASLAAAAAVVGVAYLATRTKPMTRRRR